MDISILESCGIDYSHGLARFLGDTALYESVLEMFLNDSTMDEARAAMSAMDYQALFEAAHQLKGISGNQDMTMLYGSSSCLSDMLRQNDIDEAAVATEFAVMERDYQQVTEGIRRALRA